MPEERPMHRRRQRQEMPEEAPQMPPAQRIVIDTQDEAPDWMVSAGRVSGAAQRRSGRRQAEEDTRAASSRSWGNEAPAQGAAPQREPVPQRKKTPDRAGASAQPKKMKKKPKRKLSKKARARRMRQIRRTAFSVLTCALAISLIVLGSVYVSRFIQIKRTLDLGYGVFYPNIYVNGIPLGGMTLDQAKDVVDRQVSAQVSAWKITLRTTDGRTWDITGDDVKMTYDVADQLDQLWAIGHIGTSSQRYEQVKNLDEEAVIRYTTLSYDLSSVQQILTQIKNEVDRPAVSAKRIDDNTVWPPFSYTDDVPGVELDITGLNEQISGMVDRLESGVVDLTPTPVEARITREYLEGQIVQLAMYETEISNTSTEGRFENIRLGTDKFDELIIKSGESVSFNKVTGLRTERNGYQRALELAYGRYVEGVGGGICQVSSTLYNAVVNAGLEIVSRTQHSLPSNYVAKGLDATVQDNRIDFVFKNTTNADIYIKANYYKKKSHYYCQFIIYGRPDPNGYSYKLESVVKEPIDIPEIIYEPDVNAQYVVYDDEQYVYSEGEQGYIVDVYLVTMDERGLEVSRELKYTDQYKPSAPITYVGVTPRETPTPVPMVTPND